ncbi:MAG TPA: glutaminase A [Ilumatobacteraceae bacterium]|nr:glutaminase A [Ilumatobacteraceae bacterium]
MLPDTDPPFISTGNLPPADRVRALVAAAYERFRANDEGAVSHVYPSLATVDPSSFGLCVTSVTGESFAIGDADMEFTIMSVSKPFVFALMCAALGADVVRERIGVNATGMPFNSVTAIELGSSGRTNPMVNSGAIATTSLTPGSSTDEKWDFIREGLSRFAGRELVLDDEILASATATNFRNRAIADLMQSYGALGTNAVEAVDLYTRQCSLRVTARDLAMMGATLADGGLNPSTGARVVDLLSCRAALAVMMTAGLYETSGDWVYDVGLPGKSGIGGGIVTVSPGKGGFSSFAPLLDAAGNSVKGQLATRFFAHHLGLDLFLSQPDPSIVQSAPTT